ncbi:F-box protein At2g17036-like [Chenopodium quinoa]|uniref:F-box domain-containing protein n=1 Tax=Chenopodium quinoa TaxID=63459 RepID=A0A803MFT1_CHEQI|nr:F-box protein At2g17036-like [Chenopodium quinoa]
MNSTNPMPPLNNPMKISNHSKQISWSDLPPDLLLPIAKRLATQPDVFSFRQVCKLWRASAPLSLLVSKNILSPLFPHHFTIKPDMCYAPKHYIVCMNCVILLRSNVNPELSPFIMIVDEYRSGKLYVRRPFCARPLTCYPSFGNVNLTGDPDLPPSLDLSRFRVSELARFPTLSYLRDANRIMQIKLYKQKPYDYPKPRVVLFVDPNCENCATVSDYTLVEVSQYGDLIVTRFNGESHNKFTYTSKKKGRRLVDLVNFKGKVYVIDNYHKVLSIDYHSLEPSKIVKSLKSERMGYNKFLFVSCNELYVVSMWSTMLLPLEVKEESIDFTLFKLNEKEKKWDKLEGIGDDKILFLTFDGSFVASTNDFPGCKGNCIIFFRSTSRNLYIKMDCRCYYEIYVFHFDGGDSGPISSYPGYSDIVVWPPPSWLWNYSAGSSKG